MTVKMEGMEAIVKKISVLGKPVLHKPPMTLAVKYIYGKLKKEPRKSGTWSAWADHNPASRRAYWAKVASGEARHGSGGYQRSHKLHKGWTKKVEASGRRGIVENNVDYGVYVQGERQISPHADSRYPQVEKVAKEEADFIARIFKRAYDKELAR